MKKVFMIIAAMCMTSIMASAQKTIRVSTDKTDLVMQVSPKGRLYQVYLGDKLKNPSDYNHLKWDVYAASDGSVCQRGHEVYATSGAEDFFEPAVAVTHADGNMTTYLYYQSSEEKAISGGVETIITLKDKVYPLTVKLHYAAYPKENVIKAWSEISHKEKAPVTLWRYSSTMLPIVNENDTVCITELMFTDNDELSGLIAKMMNADTLILLSNVDGIYNGDPSEPTTRIIPSVYYDRDISEYILASKSSHGRGGMTSKVKTAHDVANAGIKVIIANGNTPNILINLKEHPMETLHTEFVARPLNK
jgi:isopentenyl phosphate kinase